MSDILYKNIKSGNVELTKKGSFVIKVSSDSLDLQNEIVNQKGIMAQYPIPNLLEHDSDLIIGEIQNGEVREFEKSYSYYNYGELFLDNNKATVSKNILNDIYYQMKNGVGQFSIGYRVLESHKEMIDNKEVNVLDKIVLHEISYTMNPANTDTGIISVKSNKDELKECMNRYQEFFKKRRIVKAINEEIENINSAKTHGEVLSCMKNICSIGSIGENNNIISESRKIANNFIDSIRQFEKRCSQSKGEQEEEMNQNITQNEENFEKSREDVLVDVFKLK